MRLVASGRQADVFDLGDGRVLRRYRTQGGAEAEGRVMEHARAQGFPVPAVHEARETDLVLELLEGRTMLAELAARPWTFATQARALADLHRRLHAIEAPEELPAPFGPGGSLLHLDLHPANVVLTARGPFVIDWPAAARGPSAADAAQTWVLIATSRVDGRPAERLLGHLGRGAFVRSFLAGFDRAEVSAALPAVARARLEDPNVTEIERKAIRRLNG